MSIIVPRHCLTRKSLFKQKSILRHFWKKTNFGSKDDLKSKTKFDSLSGMDYFCDHGHFCLKKMMGNSSMKSVNSKVNY